MRISTSLLARQNAPAHNRRAEHMTVYRNQDIMIASHILLQLWRR